MATVRVHVFRSPDEVARAGADSFLQVARAAVAASGRFAAVLTGGESSQGLYKLLAQEPYRTQVPWAQVHLFWSDERCVPPDNPRSNFGMARDAFIAHVPIPGANVHRIHAETGAEHAADAYDRELHAFFGSQGLPRFDLVHLGLGSDGHIASLFPEAAVLRLRSRLAYASYYEAESEERVTLGVHVINAAARIEFIVTPAEKAEIVHRVLQGDRDPLSIPAQIVQPEGEVEWYLTREASSRLDLAALDHPFPSS